MPHLTKVGRIIHLTKIYIGDNNAFPLRRAYFLLPSVAFTPLMHLVSAQKTDKKGKNRLKVSRFLQENM